LDLNEEVVSKVLHSPTLSPVVSPVVPPGEGVSVLSALSGWSVEGEGLLCGHDRPAGRDRLAGGRSGGCSPGGLWSDWESDLRNVVVVSRGGRHNDTRLRGRCADHFRNYTITCVGTAVEAAETVARTISVTLSRGPARGNRTCALVWGEGSSGWAGSNVFPISSLCSKGALS